MAQIQDSLLSRRIRPFFGSIRFRLTLWYVLILALVLIVFGSIVYTSQAQSASAALRDNLRSDAARLVSAYDPATGQIDLTEQAKPKFSLGSNDIVITLDSGGAVLQRLGPFEDGVLPGLLSMVLSAEKLDLRGNELSAQVLKKLEAAKREGQDLGN